MSTQTDKESVVEKFFNHLPKNRDSSLYYAGIGSRETPSDVLEQMTELAKQLREQGWILRSGGAKGADIAFEQGASEDKEIFYAKDATRESCLLASTFHPFWYRMPDYAQKLHGRNVLQVLGRDMNQPVKFVVCWTKDGCESHERRSIHTGGTGTAISIASHFSIPVFNLKKEGCIERILEFAFNQKELEGYLDGTCDKT